MYSQNNNVQLMNFLQDRTQQFKNVNMRYLLFFHAKCIDFVSYITLLAFNSLIMKIKRAIQRKLSAWRKSLDRKPLIVQCTQ